MQNSRSLATLYWQCRLLYFAKRTLRYYHRYVGTPLFLPAIALLVWGGVRQWPAIVVWAAEIGLIVGLFAFTEALHKVANRVNRAETAAVDAYVSACLNANEVPRLQFVLFLRPFGCDYSSRFYYPRSGSAGSAPRRQNIIRSSAGRPMADFDGGSLVGLSQILRKIAEPLGAWVETDAAVAPQSSRLGIRLQDDHWQRQIAQLSKSARAILMVPLSDIDFSEPEILMEYLRAAPGEYEKFLTKTKRAGLEQELSMICALGLLSKTVFVLPGSLTDSEWSQVTDLLAQHGISLQKPPGMYHHASLYLFSTKQTPAVGLMTLIDGAQTGHLLWSTTDNDKCFGGNALVYLLEDDIKKRDERHAIGYGRAKPVVPWDGFRHRR